MTQSPSPRVRLGPEPDFFIYVVRPEPKPDESPTYLVIFSSLKKPELDPSTKKSGPTHLYMREIQSGMQDKKHAEQQSALAGS
jgi:hypothetical protein